MLGQVSAHRLLWLLLKVDYRIELPFEQTNRIASQLIIYICVKFCARKGDPYDDAN